MSSAIELQVNALIDALRAKEQEEKKRYDAAIDIEDMAEAKDVMFDARTKIQQLRKWAENLVELQKEIVDSFLSSNELSSQITTARGKVKPEIQSVITAIDTGNEEISDFPVSPPQAEELVELKQFDTLDNIVEVGPITLYNEVPKEFILLGKTYSTDGWDDVLVKLCEAMILKKPYKTLSIGVKKALEIGGEPVLWLDERGESDEGYRLSNGLSVVKNKTGGEIIFCCERILSLCGYDCNELKIS